MGYKAFCVNPVQENCYVLWDDVTKDAAIVDCGAWTSDEKASIRWFLNENGLVPKLALQTHAHFDHVLGLPFVEEEFGLRPMLHRDDDCVYASVPGMLRDWFHIDMKGSLPESSPVDGKDVLRLGETEIQVIHTPGHTPGGVCYYVPMMRLLFSGDTLFKMGVGRTDLPGGSYQQEIESITNKLFLLPEDTVVLPGHGPETTIGAEKDMNPYCV